MTGFKGNGLLHKSCGTGPSTWAPLYTAKIYFKNSKNKTTSENCGSWCRKCKRMAKSDETYDQRTME